MERREITAAWRAAALALCVVAVLFVLTACTKEEPEDDPYAQYVPNDEYSLTFSKFDAEKEKYDYNVIRLYDALEGEALAFELGAYDESNRTSEIKTYDSDGMTSYEYKRYIYRFNGRESLWVGTRYYEDGSEYIDYLWTDVSYGVKTYRGIAVGSTFDELIRAYPKDLYYLPPEEIMNEAGTTAMGDFYDENGKLVSKTGSVDGAYFYQSFEDNDIRDIHFYMRDGKVIAIEMFAPFELRRTYSGYNEESNLVLKPAEEGVSFRTEQAAKGDHTIQPTWEDILGFTVTDTLPQPAKFTYDLLRLDASVPQSDRVNALACGEEMMTYIAQVESGNGREFIKDTHMQNWYIRSFTEQYRDVIAFVIESRYGIYEAGGGRSFTVFYYDADTCDWISAEEYADRCSVDQDKIVQLYNEELPYGYMEAYNIYDAGFYIDAGGKIVVGWTYAT